MAHNIFGENLFSKAFQEFDETVFFEKLHNKVRNKPYFDNRFGKEYRVHYTLPQVQVRIAQYKREIQEAKDKKLAVEILNNRNNWLSYWQSKETGLLSKLATSPVIA